ncbi:hypothetical protein JTB14_023181 [Gonioctena quinquepunctata]|nr:hypothetical protein JTB14_023181 [Gonioctena quinquepunctata]
MISSIISRVVILLFGTLYPAYASYKAVRTKNVKEYVKWMMYWIVFALFTCIETFTDVFLSWFPFYYEIKIVLVIWLLSPATKGSSILYRKFVHPTLSSREQEIDEYITKAKEQSYKQVLDFGSKGVTALMQTALRSVTQLPPSLVSSFSDPQLSAHTVDKVDGMKKSKTADYLVECSLSEDEEEDFSDIYVPAKSGRKEPKEKSAVKKGGKTKGAAAAGTRKSSRKTKEIKTDGGGGIVNQLKRSYSLGDLSDTAHDDVAQDEADDVITDPRLVRRRRSPHRSSSSSSAIYFSEVDVRSDRIASIQSAEDISSGYSSGEGIYAGGVPKLAAREALQRTGSLTRTRSTRVTRSVVPKKGGGSDESDDNEVFDTNIVFHNAKNSERLPEDKTESSSSENEFLDSLDSVHENLGEELNDLNKNIERKTLLTACKENQVKIDVVVCDLTKNTSPVVLELPKQTEDEIKILNIESNMSLLEISKDVDTFSNFVQNMISTHPNTNNAIDESKIVPEAVVHIGDVENNEEPTTEKQEKINAITTFSTTEEVPLDVQKVRKGKYHKKPAPPPPAAAETPSPIKATLVLKPGVLKTLGSAESLCKEIFVSSPKSKRRTVVNRSPSSLSSTSSNSTRSKHSFSKFIKFPKKIGFWNRDELSVEKRASWHSYLGPDTRALSDSKLQSKSDNNLQTLEDIYLHAANSGRNGSQLSLNTLTDSPLAHRRLKIIRGYVDEDTD